MPRSRASSTQGRSRFLVLGLFAALLTLVLLAWSVAPANAAALVISGRSVATIAESSLEGSVDVLPRRTAPQCEGERRSFDEGLLPCAPGGGYSPRSSSRREAGVAFVRHDAPPDSQISRIRRRIPRLNADEPPWP